MTLLAIALAPVVILIIFIYHKDIQKEPKGQLAKAFFGGAILTVIGSLSCTSLLFPALWDSPETWEDPWLSLFGQAFVDAAIPEEVCKFVVLYFLIWKSKHFDEIFDGIVYSVFVSLGFACTENILYVLDGDMSTGILRAITAVPGHFLFAVIMGYYFSLAKFKPDHKTSYLFKSLFCAILAHGLYDGILMSIDALKVENEFILLVICIAFIALIIKLWKIGLKHIRELSGSKDPHPALKDNK